MSAVLSLFTSFFAGNLAALSPCVLPVLPIMVGSSGQTNRKGPLVLAAGIIFSFTLLGLVFSTTTSVLGFSESMIRTASATLLMISGLVLMSSMLKQRLADFSAPLSNLANRASTWFESKGLWGQFGMGALLGAAWSPCIGPTLGAVLGIVSTEGSLVKGAALLGVFGLGLSVPFLAIAYGFRNVVSKNRSLLLKLNQWGTPVLGFFLTVTGLLLVTGASKFIEAFMVDLLPAGLLEFITAY